MPLSIVGAGFGRTGTLSLKAALEALGFGPCYHMTEVLGNPGHSQRWLDACDGRVDWDAMFDGYASAVDWPSCAFWRELAAHYPDARVLLSVRPPHAWHDSVMATIYQPMVMELRPGAPEPLRIQMTMARRLILEGTFGGRLSDREHAVAVYERHNQSVRDAFAGSDRLLVYEVGSGWEPLCDWLGVAVPDGDFPRLNDKESFRERFRLE